MIYIFMLPLGIGFSKYNYILPILSVFLTAVVFLDSIIKLNSGIVIDSTIDMEPKQVRQYYRKSKCIIICSLTCLPIVFIITPIALTDSRYYWILLFNTIPTFVLFWDTTRTFLLLEYIDQFRKSSLSLAIINGIVLLVIAFYYV